MAGNTHGIKLNHDRWLADPLYRRRHADIIMQALAPNAVTDLQWDHSKCPANCPPFDDRRLGEGIAA